MDVDEPLQQENLSRAGSPHPATELLLGDQQQTLTIQRQKLRVGQVVGVQVHGTISDGLEAPHPSATVPTTAPKPKFKDGQNVTAEFQEKVGAGWSPMQHEGKINSTYIKHKKYFYWIDYDDEDQHLCVPENRIRNQTDTEKPRSSQKRKRTLKQPKVVVQRPDKRLCKPTQIIDHGYKE